MDRFTRGIAIASARHPWRTITSWVLVLGAVFFLAASGGGTFADDFSAPGSQSDRATELLDRELPRGRQGHGPRRPRRPRTVRRSPTSARQVADGAGRRRRPRPRRLGRRPVRGRHHLGGRADRVRRADPRRPRARDGQAGLRRALRRRLRHAGVPGVRVELGGDAVFLNAEDKQHRPRRHRPPRRAPRPARRVRHRRRRRSSRSACRSSRSAPASAASRCWPAPWTCRSPPSRSPASSGSASASTTRCSWSPATGRTAPRARTTSGHSADAMGTSGAAVVFAGGTVVVATAALAITGVGVLTSIGLATSLMVLFSVAAADHPAARPAQPARRPHRQGPPGPPSPPGQGRRGHRLVAVRAPRLRPPVALPARLRRRPARHRRPGAVDADRLPGRRRRPGRDHPPAGLRPARRGLRHRHQRAADRRRRPRRARRRRRRRARAGPRHRRRPRHRLGRRRRRSPPDGDTVVFTATPDHRPGRPRRPRPRSTGSATSSPATSTSPGITAITDDLNAQLATTLPLFIGAVIAVSFLLLMLVFRSIVVPLKAALMNLLSIGAAYGVLVAVFQWGWGSELLGLEGPTPITSIIVVIMFPILFGLSMDYEVFLLSRIREEYDRDRRQHRVGRPRSRRHRPGGHLGGADHGRGLPQLRRQPGAVAEDARPRTRHRDPHRRHPHPDGARAGDDGAARQGQLVAARAGSTGCCRT